MRLPAVLMQNLLRLFFTIRRSDTNPEDEPARRHERLQRFGSHRPKNADRHQSPDSSGDERRQQAP